MLESRFVSTGAGSVPAPSTVTENGLDVLILRSRLNASARCLLEAMGVTIRPVIWHEVVGPAVYRLLAGHAPRVEWLSPAQAEDLVAALKQDEDEVDLPQWAHLLLYDWRRGTLTDFDGGIDFGESGLDAATVVRDLLHYPA